MTEWLVLFLASTLSQADELRYVYQRIGFQCLTETLFDDAGRHFFAGHLDPRVLIRFYPNLYGSLFDEDESVDIFSGVVEHMPPEDSIDDISESRTAPLLPLPLLLSPAPNFDLTHPLCTPFLALRRARGPDLAPPPSRACVAGG